MSDQRTYEDALAKALGIAGAVNGLTDRGYAVEWDCEAECYRVDGITVSDATLLEMAAAVRSGHLAQ